MPELRELGYQILVISPDTPDTQAEILEGAKTDYRMLSDAGLDAARGFGIAFRMDEKMRAQFKAFGVDAEALPVPSVFIATQSGKIAFQYVNPDYTVRLTPDVLLAAAKAARVTR